MISAMDFTEEFETDEYVAVIQTIRRTIDDAKILELNGSWEEVQQKLKSLDRNFENILNKTPPISESASSSFNDLRSLKQELLEHLKLCNDKLSLSPEVVNPLQSEGAMLTNTSSGKSDFAENLNSGSTMDSISTANSNPLQSEEVMLTNISSAKSDFAENLNSDSTMNSISTANSIINDTDSCTDSLIDEMMADEGVESAEMIYSCSGASLYFISDSGRVTMSSSPNTARIFQVGVKDAKSAPTYYLQIHTFVYPLVRQVSPCVRTEFGAVLFPNFKADETIDADYQSVGLIVPKDHEEKFILLLENILGTKIAFCNTSEKQSSNIYGNKIASTFVSGAQSVSEFLVQSAQKAEEFMDGSTPKIIEKINPSSRERRFAPCVKNGLKIARDVTSVTASVTGFVASKVGAATFALGQFLAPHIRDNGGRILSQTTGMDVARANEKIDSFLNVTAGAVEGLATIYSGLETSAVIFGRSLTSNTVQIVKHRYGGPTAELTQDTFETVSNGIEIGTNIRMFKPKSLAKTAVKGFIDKGSKSATTCDQKNESPRCMFGERLANNLDSQSSLMAVGMNIKPDEHQKRVDYSEVVTSCNQSKKTEQPESTVAIES